MGLCFIIDPIDGTTNFIRNFEHSAISVGLAVDRKMVAGVVYDVDKDNLYAAQRGCGATLNGRAIHANRSDLDHSLLLFGSCPYERELAHRTFQMVEKAYTRVLEIRRTGSAALDICYVASGKADLYFELILRPWDYAAAIVIVEEAGGVICTNLCPLTRSSAYAAATARTWRNLMSWCRTCEVLHFRQSLLAAAIRLQGV